MSDILYVKIGQKVHVRQPSVRIGELGTLWCPDRSVEAKCSALHYTTVHGSREVGDILDVAKTIQKEYPSVTVENLGETDFIIEYVKEKSSKAWEYAKAAIVCLIIFFGAAFSIMAFNSDAGVDKVFANMHQMLSGKERTGMTWLELGYMAGLFLGILVFYDHFRRRKRLNDPTPLDVEMKDYERQVNQTVLDECERRKENKKRCKGNKVSGGDNYAS